MIHRLEIGGENWSDYLLSARVSYRADPGSSGLEMSVVGSLEDYANARIRLWLGYSPDTMVLYFSGFLHQPKDSDTLPTSDATGFGPFRTMLGKALGTNETFVGKTFEYVVMECAQRAQTMPGEVVVMNGNTYRVQPGESFPFDNKIGDVLNTLMGKANFVGVDVPGGKRLFMPKPIPGSNTKFKREYTPDTYVEFGLTPTAESSYKKVVVYRNGDNGRPVVYAEQEVNAQLRFQPKDNEWFVVSDFAGNQLAAGAEAYRLAEDLRQGQQKFTLKTFFDQDITLFDGFKATRFKNGQQRTYSCFIDEGIDVEYSPGSPGLMTMSGMAYEIKRLRGSVPVTDKRFAYSGQVIPAASEKLDIVL